MTYIEELSKPFPIDKVKQRPGPGGIKLDYIAGEDIIEKLNTLLDNNWHWNSSYEIHQSDNKWIVFVRGDLVIEECSRTGMGSFVHADPDMAIKSANTEALKNASKHYGVALYLWNAGEREKVAQERAEGSPKTIAGLKKAVLDLAMKQGLLGHPSKEGLAKHFGIAEPSDLDNRDVLEGILDGSL